MLGGLEDVEGGVVGSRKKGFDKSEVRRGDWSHTECGLQSV